MVRQSMKLYLLRHSERGEITVNGRTKYEAVLAASKKWGVPWTQLARESEFIVLCEEGPENETKAEK